MLVVSLAVPVWAGASDVESVAVERAEETLIEEALTEPVSADEPPDSADTIFIEPVVQDALSDLSAEENPTSEAAEENEAQSEEPQITPAADPNLGATIYNSSNPYSGLIGTISRLYLVL